MPSRRAAAGRPAALCAIPRRAGLALIAIPRRVALAVFAIARQAALALLPNLGPALAMAAAGAGLAPAAAAEHWHLGQLDLQACAVGTTSAHGIPSQAAYCTDFPVPEDWDHPQGRQIRLHVAVVRAQAAEAVPDIAVFLDGGPGGAATQDYPALAKALAPLRKQRHLLLVDQRGTGESNPLDCDDAPAPDRAAPAGTPAAARADAQAPGGGAPAPRAPPARTEPVQHIRACAQRLAPRAAPEFYTTTDAIRDLEALRLALGGPALDLIGVSYGTRVAQQYARRYPAAVRSIVLDSAVPNQLVLLSEHARNLEDVVQRRLGRCRADPPCQARYGDSYAALKQVQALLQRAPQSVQMRDPLSFALVQRTLGADELAALVRFYTYSATTSALLPYVVAEAQAGRYAPLLSQATLVIGDVADHINGGMAASVLCAEDADLLVERPQDAGTLLGAAIVSEARRSCEAWPHRQRPADFHEPFRGTMPVLVLAGEFDPVTPPRYAEQIVRDLPHARLLLAKGQGHAVAGVGCMPRLLALFVEQLDPQHLDDQCLAALGETAAFLGVNGSAP
jgi:pimeloyl-ACP methyl ester carboxylesterase